MSPEGLKPGSARRVLVVEDEMMIAMLVEDMLRELGYATVGPASSLSAAMTLVRDQADRIDIAILDINLDGQRSFPVAELLRAQGTPFIFATGYGALGLEDPFRDTLTLNKPFRLENLAAALQSALG